MAMTRPLRSTGITPLQRYYEAVHVPYKSPIELRAAYMPDAAWAVSGIPKLIPEAGSAPGFDIA